MKTVAYIVTGVGLGILTLGILVQDLPHTVAGFLIEIIGGSVIGLMLQERRDLSDEEAAALDWVINLFRDTCPLNKGQIRQLVIQRLNDPEKRFGGYWENYVWEVFVKKLNGDLS